MELKRTRHQFQSRLKLQMILQRRDPPITTINSFTFYGICHENKSCLQYVYGKRYCCVFTFVLAWYRCVFTFVLAWYCCVFTFVLAWYCCVFTFVLAYYVFVFLLIFCVWLSWFVSYIWHFVFVACLISWFVRPARPANFQLVRPARQLVPYLNPYLNHDPNHKPNSNLNPYTNHYPYPKLNITLIIIQTWLDYNPNHYPTLNPNPNHYTNLKITNPNLKMIYVRRRSPAQHLSSKTWSHKKRIKHKTPKHEIDF